MREMCFLLIISSLFLSGCVLGAPSMQASCPPGLTSADISAAIVSSLRQNGFPVSEVRPEMGLVMSDWRKTTIAGAELGGAIIPGTRHAKAHNQRMKMEFIIDRGNLAMTILPYKQQESETDSWSDVSLDSADMMIVQNVVLSTVSRMDGSVGDLQWSYGREHDPRKQYEQRQSGIGKKAGIIAVAIGAVMVAAFVSLESMD